MRFAVTCLFLVACSSSSPSTNQPATAEKNESPATSAVGGADAGANGSDGSSVVPDGTLAWEPVVLPTGGTLSTLAVSSKYVWLASSVFGDPSTFAILASPGDGSWVPWWTTTQEKLVAYSYLPTAALAVNDDEVVFGASTYLMTATATGSADTPISNSASYISALIPFDSTSFLALNRVGQIKQVSRLPPHESNSECDVAWKNVDYQGIAVGGDRMYVFSVMGVTPNGTQENKLYSVPRTCLTGGTLSPITPTHVSDGAFEAIASVDDLVVIVGNSGSIATIAKDSKTVVQASTTDDLVGVALRSKSDGYAVGKNTLLHFDGTSWTRVTESGAPPGGSQVAFAEDGTAWILGSDGTHLYRRGPTGSSQ